MLNAEDVKDRNDAHVIDHSPPATQSAQIARNASAVSNLLSNGHTRPPVNNSQRSASAGAGSRSTASEGVTSTPSLTTATPMPFIHLGTTLVNARSSQGYIMTVTFAQGVNDPGIHLVACDGTFMLHETLAHFSDHLSPTLSLSWKSSPSPPTLHGRIFRYPHVCARENAALQFNGSACWVGH